MLTNHEYLAHIVNKEFGTQSISNRLFDNKEKIEWKDFDLLRVNNQEELNETIVRNGNNTYSEMAFSILSKKKSIMDIFTYN